MAVILVIDDELAILNAFELLFQKQGYTVYTATTGIYGLELFHHYQPDIVFLDIDLPDQNGIDVLCQFMAERSGGVKVIVMSVLRNPDIRRQAIQYGAYHYLLKPLDIEILEQLVETL